MPILSHNEARTLARRILAMAKVKEAQVALSGGPVSHLRFATNQVTTSGQADDLVVQFTAFDGKRHATATANQTDDASLKRLVEQAERLARVAPEDPERMPLLGEQDYPVTGGFVGATARLSPATRAHDASKAINAATANKVIGAGFYLNRGGFSSLANSRGLFAYDTSSAATFTMTARTPDGRGSGYAAADSFDAARIDTAEVAAHASAKALDSAAARELPPAAYTVVLEPQAVADLLSVIRFAGLDARAADEGRSVFSAPGGKNRIGEKLFPPFITLFTDPRHRIVPGLAFTSEGLPARLVNFIREGVLENLVYTRFWAEKQEKQPTGPPVNLILGGGEHSVADMIASTERGLLITRLWYIRVVNSQTLLYTGLTRDGVFLIEKGKLSHAVRNFRFNESPVELLRQTEMLGPQQRVVSSEQGRFPMYFPPMKVRAFRFTSLSEAV
jgi:predicted Zn-dependent protease